MSQFVLELQGITKTFPGVKALDNVHFQLGPGQIHALMGENGAGKSTFIKVITGVHQPDRGEIFLNGRKVSFQNPREAIAAGIAAIYQHVTCYPDLSITENIFMGHEDVTPGIRKIRWKEMHEKAGVLLRQLDCHIDPRTPMGALSVAQQQIIEIAKALSTNANIIIMDEPTASLTKNESEDLYTITEKLRDAGKSIIFITHRFEDMYRLASQVTVFRDACYIGTWPVDGITNADLITAMVGRSLTEFYPPSAATPGEELLRVENLGRTGYFRDISFNVRKGEIVALTGLVGAGRSEVVQAIFGADPLDTGKVFLAGNQVEIRRPRDAMRLGIGFLPENRQIQGLVMGWSIERNITLANLAAFTKATIINTDAENRAAAGLARQVSVKCGSVSDLVSSLSGGNQQKVIVAKLLSTDLKLIIMDEPTKGVDVGAKYSIYQIMRQLTAQGYGILMVSSEMPEVLGMSDRIVVMHSGRVTMVTETPNATQEAILHAALAQHA